MSRLPITAAVIVVSGVLAAPVGGFGERRAARSRDWAYAVAIQPDGKLVVAGRSVSGGWRFAVARYTARGRLDPTFGSGGKVRTALGSNRDEAAAGVAVERGGRIVVAGRTRATSGVDAVGLARYTARGRLDGAFGRGGKVVTTFGIRKRISGWAHAVAMQPDGKAVAVGGSGPLIDGPYRCTLVRYTSRGRLDATFGRHGVVTTHAGSDSDALAAAIQADGRIVAAGRGQAGEDTVFMLERYTPRGRLDPTFGSAGKAIARFGSYGYAQAVALQHDGKIVAAGSADVDDFGLARYSARGTLDATFGKGGRVTTNLGNRNGSPSSDKALALAIQRDGRIVVAGATDLRGSCGEMRCYTDDFALVRYLPDGSRDSSFGRDGLIVTPFSGDVEVDALAIDTRGRIVAVGGGSGYFALARYTPTGTLDPSFGNGGKVETTFLG
jgi:uncharacterized delta-60 repeat protein